ncbi:GINS complex subunit [Diplodia intermedia]|uniref:GINS complex subunit n=1 Tax=Diplodia intermedia TaxID=856260 RepID=A0ABR3TXJ7_9PEZI
MDIDDILAEVSRDSPAQQHDQAARDLQDLTRLWVAERVAPEILPYPDALMERVLDRVRRQIEVVEEQTGNMDPKTNFRLILYQTELERFKFLVRSFLRARIAKSASIWNSTRHCFRDITLHLFFRPFHLNYNVWTTRLAA